MVRVVRVGRAAANAALMATLIKPMVRLTVRRWRKRAEESPATTIGIPVQELVEAALIEELAPSLAAPLAELEGSSQEVVEELAGRSAMRTLLIVATAAAVTAGVAVAVARLVQRRRAARAAEAKDSDWVAVAVEDAAEEVEEADLLEALAQ